MPKIHAALLIGLALALFLLLPSAQARGQAPAAYSVFIPVVNIPCHTNPEWLQYTNHFRRLSDLPDVCEEVQLSENVWLHARYIVKTDELNHYENPTSPWYSAAGDQAARASNLAASYSQRDDRWSIETWMQAPFHALGILDPRLKRVGYARYWEQDGGYVTGAGMDVLHGMEYYPPPELYPVVFPGRDSTIGLTTHWGERPSPLTSCPGYQVPSGLPIILQLGTGSLTPVVSGYSLRMDGEPVEACVFDETNYSFPDPAWQQTGRQILNSRDALVMVPRAPLQPGKTYQVSMMVNGTPYTWSFSVASDAR